MISAVMKKGNEHEISGNHFKYDNRGKGRLLKW